MNGPRACRATTADGSPCQSPFVDLATGYCAAHGPGGSAKMRARGRRGAEATIDKMRGKGTVKPGEAPEPPETIEDVKLIAAWATRAVLIGEIDPRIAREVTALLREFRSAVKESDMAAELAELRKELVAMKAKGGAR